MVIFLQTKVNVCASGGESGLENGDVLVFPDMVLYRSVCFMEF